MFRRKQAGRTLFIRRFFLLSLLLLCTAARANQVALVGNEDYPGVGAFNLFGPLPNPHEDAEDMAELLRAHGFEVLLLKDADKHALERAVYCVSGVDSDPRRCPPRYRAQRGGTLLFYYSGHGAQVWETGRYFNYLASAGRGYANGADLKSYGLG